MKEMNIMSSGVWKRLKNIFTSYMNSVIEQVLFLIEFTHIIYMHVLLKFLQNWVDSTG
jgi:hypothetical protein